MVKTHNSSSFVLLSLEDIQKETQKVILQIEKTNTKFTNGQECYLCEVVPESVFRVSRNSTMLSEEICKLNSEKRKLERRIRQLENKLKEQGGVTST